MQVAHWVLDATLAGGQAVALHAAELAEGSGHRTGFIVDGAGPLTDIATARGMAVIPFGLPRTHQLWRALALAQLLRDHSIELLHVGILTARGKVARAGFRGDFCA